ncbi:MAG: SurA N-terminal domain-containing protein [Patescibacteria group bacterium]
MATKKTIKSAPKKATKSAKKVTKTATSVKVAPKVQEALATKGVKKEKMVEEKKVEPAKQENTKTATSAFKLRKSHVILIGVIVLVGAFLYFFRGLFVAAVVNGQPISRMSVVNEAEKQSGKQALETLVRNNLIEQEAQKQKVSVTEKEIDDEIKKVESQLAKQGQKIDDVLAIQGMTKEDLRELIRLDKLVGKIVGKDIKITDEEINKYIEENKEMLPADQDENPLKASVKEQLNQQKLNEKVRTWLEGIQKKANIMYFVQY